MIRALVVLACLCGHPDPPSPPDRPGPTEPAGTPGDGPSDGASTTNCALWPDAVDCLHGANAGSGGPATWPGSNTWCRDVRYPDGVWRICSPRQP